MSEVLANGKLLEFQTAKFNELEQLVDSGFTKMTDELKEMKNDLREMTGELRTGFQGVTSELRITRDQGVVPVPVLKDIMAANNDAYKDIFKTTNENFKSMMTDSSSSQKAMVKIICYSLGAMMAAYTSTKYLAPDVPAVQISSPQQVEVKGIE